MNIIKKYVLNEIKKIFEKCKKHYLDDSGIIEFVQSGYYDIGHDLEFLYHEIKNTPIAIERDKLEYESQVEYWSKQRKENKEKKKLSKELKKDE